ncbi:MAG TPA: AAA family ATPase [Microlunatus sp.]|nr:AAA family ATPase [Microlunatus sp.]
MLVGRSEECTALLGAIDDARHQTSRVFLLRGEPGIGKSRLLSFVAEHAGGFLHATGRGVVTESELSYAVLLDVLTPLLPFVSRLSESRQNVLHSALGSGPPVGAEPFAVYLAVLELVTVVAADQPVLLMVDDCQWVDESSLNCLAFVARRLRADSVLIILTERSGFAGGGPTRALQGFPVLSLNALPAKHVRKIVGELAPSMSGFDVDVVVDRARGNPLAVEEFCRRLGDAGDLEDPAWSEVSQLETTYSSALHSLPTKALRAVEALAVLGEARPQIFTAVLAADHLTLSDVEPAETANVVEIGGDTVLFRHPLIQLVAYNSIAPSRRRALHRLVADVYAPLDQFGDRERCAWHRVAGTIGPDEDLATELERLGQLAVSRSSAPTAVNLFETAARLSVAPEGKVARLLAAAEHVQSAGAMERADPLLDEADSCAAGTDAALAVEHLRCRFDMWRGQPAQARDRLLGLARITAAVSPTSAAVMLGHAAVTSLWLGDLSHAQGAIDECGLLNIEESVMPLNVLAASSLIDLVCGRRPSGHGKLTTALGRLDEVNPLAADQTGLVVALAQFAAGHQAEAITAIEAAVRVLRERAAVGLLPFQLSRLSAMQLAADRWPAAYVSASAAVEIVTQSGWVTELPATLAALAQIEAVRGDEEACRRHADEALEGGRRAHSRMLDAQVRVALGRLSLGLGQPDEAVQHLELVDAFAHDRGLVENPILSWVPDLVEALVLTGEANTARTVAAEHEEELIGQGRSAVWYRCQALTETSPARRVAALRASIDQATAAGAQFEHARSLLWLGRLQLLEGRSGRARSALMLALAIFEHLGATGWACQTRAELGGKGMAVIVEDQRLHRLSAQEMSVALSVAEGLSNRQVAARLFLSVRTVEFHLSNAYRKLGISSRTQLVSTLNASPRKNFARSLA